MMADGDDRTLIVIAVFGISVSLIMTVGISVFFLPTNGDYELDEILDYRQDLVSFSGQTMINETPWIMTSVYTPWNSSLPVEGHVDPDGWLFGERIDDYSSIGKAADIRLDPNQKSSVPITVSDTIMSYEVSDGFKWWVDAGGALPFLSPITLQFAEWFDLDPIDTTLAPASIWNYSGYRYVFDPSLPFAATEEDRPSSVDGSLSIVWYAYNGQEGISGALQIYGGDVLLASYAATDIIAAYNGSSGYATIYEFDFNGAKLNLSIRFDQDVIQNGTPLMQAFVAGDWSMAISSKSAGNFFDVENSAAFDLTAGSLIETFINVFTFDLPGTSSPWADLILWLLVVLPMSLAMACITLRLISSIRIFGGL